MKLDEGIQKVTGEMERKKKNKWEQKHGGKKGEKS